LLSASKLEISKFLFNDLINVESHSKDKAEKGLYVIDSKSQLAHLTIDLKMPVNI